jgi:hypothetical protein
MNQNGTSQDTAKGVGSMTSKHLNAIHKAIRNNTTEMNDYPSTPVIYLEGFVSDFLAHAKESNPNVKTRLFVKGLVPGPKFERDMVERHGE